MRLTTSLSQTSNWPFRNTVSQELHSVDKASRSMISKSRGNSVLVHSYPNWQKEMTVKEIGPIHSKPIWVNSRHMAIIQKQITIPIMNLTSLDRVRSETFNMILKCQPRVMTSVQNEKIQRVARAVEAVIHRATICRHLVLPLKSQLNIKLLTKLPTRTM